MQYSKTHFLFIGLSRYAWALMVLLLVSAPASLVRANDFIGGDMGLPSSSADNNLVNPDTVTPPPPPKLSPAAAAELVRTKVGGQVMSVNTQQRETGVVYGVKVLHGGRMRVINVDGHTGQLLNH